MPVGLPIMSKNNVLLLFLEQLVHKRDTSYIHVCFGVEVTGFFSDQSCINAVKIILEECDNKTSHCMMLHFTVYTGLVKEACERPGQGRSLVHTDEKTEAEGSGTLTKCPWLLSGKRQDF